MQPSAPTKPIWIIGMILGILGILGHFVDVNFITEYHFLLLLGGFVLLALGTLLKGL